MTPIEQLAEIVNMPEYDEIASGINQLRAVFLDNPHIFAHVDGLVQIMPRLKNIVQGLTPMLSEGEGEEEPSSEE